MPELEWFEDATSDDVRERRFEFDHEGRRVPGLLWSPPETSGPRPLVLLGHGASGHKRQDYVLWLARRLVRKFSFAAASIDGPVHGHRRDYLQPPRKAAGSEAVFFDFAARWSSDPAMTDEMVGDLSATLDALQAFPEVGDGPVGWWGLSMGTILGLPFVAAEPRVKAAVLGLMGLTGPTRERIERDAPNVMCPVLFLVQLGDELFSRDSSIALFDALGSRDKRLHASMGSHGAVPEEEMAASERFLARYLTS